MKKIYMFLILAAIAMMNTSCFILLGGSGSSSSSSSTTSSTPTVDYAPQNIKSGAYIEFEHAATGTIHIVFETNNVANIPACTATNGRINAAYYKYDGFNMATLTFNYSPNGGMSSQYKAELNFKYETGGEIVFPADNTKATFKYRP